MYYGPLLTAWGGLCLAGLAHNLSERSAASRALAQITAMVHVARAWSCCLPSPAASPVFVFCVEEFEPVPLVLMMEG